MAVQIKYGEKKLKTLENGQRAILQTKDTQLEENVKIEVSGFNLQEKEATANGEYYPDSGSYGLSKVVVNVENVIPEGYIQPEGELNIDANDEYNVTEFAKVIVNVPGEVIEPYDGSMTIV